MRRASSVAFIRQEPAWRKALRLARRNWGLYLLLLPALVYLAVFNYAPMYGIQIAFRNFNFADGISGSAWAGTKWFEFFFHSAKFWPVVRNTLLISFYSLLATFPIPIILALVLHNVNHRGFKRVAQTITYLPHFISMVVVVGMISCFTSVNSGWINTVIEALGRRAGLLHGPSGILPAPLRLVGRLAGGGLGLDHLHGGADGHQPGNARGRDDRRRQQVPAHRAHRPH